MHEVINQASLGLMSNEVAQFQEERALNEHAEKLTRLPAVFSRLD